jgi:hypothetical protein
METKTIYKTFGYGKSIAEIIYNTSLWTEECTFIKTELNFLKKLIQNYPFSTNIPNLFERVQLFITDLSNLGNEKTNLLQEIENYKNELLNEEEYHHLDHDNYYLIEYQKLAKSRFNFKKNYKVLKSEIFEYLEGLIDSKVDTNLEISQL